MEKQLLKGTKTRENLMKAFAGESTARNRYCIFADLAEKEGLIQISKIFMNTALNEKEHAEIYFKFLDGDDVEINNISFPSCFGSTLQNLLCAAKYEEEEHSVMYPQYGQIAKEEGFKEISKAFFSIAQIEQHHSERYSKLAQRLKEDILFKSENNTKWVCSHCGYITESKSAPAKCPVCEKPKGYFEILCDCL